MHPPFPCRSIVAPTPNLSKRRYALRLVVVLCQYLPSPSQSFQPIFPSLLSHISSVAVPYLLRCRIHPCCPASPTPFSSAAVFIADLVCHPYYPASPFRLYCYPPVSLLRSSSHYVSLSHVLCCRYLSTFYNRFFSLFCIVLYYTA